MQLPRVSRCTETSKHLIGAACLATLVLLTTAGCSMSSRQPVNLPPTGPELKVMALGDSITAADRVPGGYRLQMAKELKEKGNRFVFVGSQTDDELAADVRAHEGHSGFWIENLDEQDETWLALQPDIVVLMAGTNNILNNAGAEAPARMTALLQSISKSVPRAEIVVSTIPPLREFQPQVDAFNAALPGVVDGAKAAGLKVRLVDAGSSFSLGDLDDDGIHPNTVKGYNAFGTAAGVPVNEIYSKLKSS